MKSFKFFSAKVELNYHLAISTHLNIGIYLSIAKYSNIIRRIFKSIEQ